MTVLAGAESAPSAAFPTASGPRSTRGRGYGRYVGLKVAGAVGSLAFMLVLNFFLFRVLPGDPARTLGRGRFSTPEQLAEFREAYGLEQPLGQQFVTYLKNTLTGDLGISLRYRVPVSDLILDRLWPTLLLVGLSTLLATAIGLWIGMIGAWHRGGGFDRLSTGVTLTLYSMPEWWLGLLLIAVLAVGLGPIPGLFPISGLYDPSTGDRLSVNGLVDLAQHLFLPVLTLTLAYLADYSLIMRSALLDELGEDYLVTARAKGLRDTDVRRRHAVRNALLPTTTIVALNLGFVVSGAITVETVFSIPGLGLLTTEALFIPDYWVLQGTLLVASASVIVANLVTNLLYGLLDPRVRT